MLTTVAVETGRNLFILWDEPFWQVLYLFHHLQERDARRALRDRVERVDMGILNAFAFNRPESLDDELRHVQSAIEAHERGPAEVSDVAALRARGEAMIARIQAGRVLSDEALVA